MSASKQLQFLAQRDGIDDGHELGWRYGIDKIPVNLDNLSAEMAGYRIVRYGLEDRDRAIYIERYIGVFKNFFWVAYSK